MNPSLHQEKKQTLPELARTTKKTFLLFSKKFLLRAFGSVSSVCAGLNRRLSPPGSEVGVGYW